MKKLLGVSLAAMLAVSPMMAHAAEGDKTVANINAVNMEANSNIATTSFVAGAYDAIAAEHNKVVADMAVTSGNYVDSAKKIGVNVKALDTAVGAVTGDSHNHIANSTTNSVAANLEALDSAVGKVSGTVYNIDASANLSANVQTLDTKMGNVTSNLTSTKGALNTAGNRADLVTAIVAINDAVADASTAATVNSGHYIGKLGNSSTNVSGALTGLDDAAKQNSDAIGAILNSNIPVYASWSNQSTATQVSIASLQVVGQTTAAVQPAQDASNTAPAPVTGG